MMSILSSRVTVLQVQVSICQLQVSIRQEGCVHTVDTSTNQNIQYSFKSVEFSIHKHWFKEITLLKCETENSKTPDCLFIPLSSIWNLEMKEYKETKNSFELDKQIMYFKDKGLINGCGFLVPLINLFKAYFNDNNELIEQIKLIKSL